MAPMNAKKKKTNLQAFKNELVISEKCSLNLNEKCTSYREEVVSHSSTLTFLRFVAVETAVVQCIQLHLIIDHAYNVLTYNLYVPNCSCQNLQNLF